MDRSDSEPVGCVSIHRTFARKGGRILAAWRHMAVAPSPVNTDESQYVIKSQRLGIIHSAICADFCYTGYTLLLSLVFAYIYTLSRKVYRFWGIERGFGGGKNG